MPVVVRESAGRARNEFNFISHNMFFAHPRNTLSDLFIARFALLIRLVDMQNSLG